MSAPCHWEPRSDGATAGDTRGDPGSPPPLRPAPPDLAWSPARPGAAPGSRGARGCAGLADHRRRTRPCTPRAGVWGRGVWGPAPRPATPFPAVWGRGLSLSGISGSASLVMSLGRQDHAARPPNPSGSRVHPAFYCPHCCGSFPEEWPGVRGEGLRPMPPAPPSARRPRLGTGGFLGSCLTGQTLCPSAPTWTLPGTCPGAARHLLRQRTLQLLQV